MKMPAAGLALTTCTTRIFSIFILFCAAGECGRQVRRPGRSPRQSQPRSAPADASRTGRLPVRRVVLYKNGIGYFEHLGQRDRQSARDSSSSRARS